jgi:hypothetical protein
VFGQNHLFVKMFLSGIPLFRVMKILHSFQVKSFQSPCQPSGRSCHPVLTPISPPFHLFGRRALPSERQSDQASSVRTTCIFRPDLYCIEKLLIQLVSIWTPLSDRSASDSFQVQFKGRLLQLSGRRGFSSGRAHT